MKYILFLILSISTTAITAQPFFDIVRFNHNISSNNNNDELSIQRFQLNLPLNPNASNKILVGAEAQKTHLIQALLAPQAPNERSISFYDYSVYLAYNHKFNDKWDSYLRYTPRWRFTGDRWNSEGLQNGLLSVTNYKKSDRLTYKFGVFYNNEEFGAFVIPLAGVDYIINERMRLFILAPSFSRFEYQLKPKSWYTGLAHFSPVSTYHVPGHADAFYRNEMIYIYAFLEKDFKPITAYCQLGYSAKNKFIPHGFKQNFSAPIVFKDDNFLNTFYISLGLALRIRT